MKSEKEEAIRKLIDAFAKDYPRRNHVILIDLTTGTYQVDHVLSRELGQRKNDESTLPENWNQE